MSHLRFALACVLATLLLAPAASAQAPARTISVTGDASLKAANDTARVGFDVEGLTGFFDHSMSRSARTTSESSSRRSTHEA